MHIKYTLFLTVSDDSSPDLGDGSTELISA